MKAKRGIDKQEIQETVKNLTKKYSVETEYNKIIKELTSKYYKNSLEYAEEYLSEICSQYINASKKEA